MDIQDSLRSEIRAILGNNALSERKKSAEIQRLMSSNKLDIRDDGASSSVPTYHDTDKKILGCQHYQLKAKIRAECCNKWVTCRFCHNEAHGHTMDRFAVEQMKCMLCLEEQPLSQQCQKCKTEMARYFCSKCRLLDDGPHKEIFHCDECKICLSGRADAYFHCPKCNACVATKFQDTHGCRDQIMHADCPICGEQFYDSAQAIVQAPCKHLIHEQCLSQSLKYSYKCPLCLASVCDTRAVFCEIDEYMRISRMPTEYRNKKAHIFCNDCCQRSAAKYHFVYHRCGKCSSYNTSVVSTT